jgi:hypothetical protein
MRSFLSGIADIGSMREFATPDRARTDRPIMNDL